MAKEIYDKKLAQLCSNIDEQALIDACKWIDNNGLPSNRKAQGISFIIFNKREYPIKYVLEIANNEIKKNQTKLGPEGEYDPKSHAERAMEFLFPNPQKFKIATYMNKEGLLILDRYRKQVISYAKQYGAEIKDISKKKKDVYKNGTHKIVETWVAKYTMVKIGNFIAEVSQISDICPYYGFDFNIDFNLLNPIHQKWIEKYYCASINCECDVEKTYRIIEYAAKNLK